MVVLLVIAFDDRGVPAEVPVVEWPDVILLVGDVAVHRHHVVHDYCAHRFSSRFLAHSAPDLVAPSGDWSCKKSISGYRNVVRREPLRGGEPAPQGQVFRRGMAGEVLDLPAEVGLVKVARRL